MQFHQVDLATAWYGCIHTSLYKYNLCQLQKDRKVRRVSG